MFHSPKPCREHRCLTTGWLWFSIKFLIWTFSISPQNEHLFCIIPLNNCCRMWQRFWSTPTMSCPADRGSQSCVVLYFLLPTMHLLFPIRIFRIWWPTGNIKFTHNLRPNYDTAEKKVISPRKITVWDANVTEHGVEGKAGEERGTKLERTEERKSKTSPIKIGRMN